jgi:hypothetical protein
MDIHSIKPTPRFTSMGGGVAGHVSPRRTAAIEKGRKQNEVRA